MTKYSLDFYLDEEQEKRLERLTLAFNKRNNTHVSCSNMLFGMVYIDGLFGTYERVYLPELEEGEDTNV